MTKTIRIKSCNECPHFAYFPADVFEGECTNIVMRGRTEDTRIVNRDAIPKWCPL